MEHQLDLWLKWLNLIKELATLVGGLIVALVTAFWVYTKFILERGLLPPSEFDLDCSAVGEHGDRNILEVSAHIKNLGRSTLIVSNLRIDIKYLEEMPKPLLNEEVFFLKPDDERLGSLRFPKSLLKDVLGFRGKIFVGKKGEIIRHEDRLFEIGERPLILVNDQPIESNELTRAPEGRKEWDAEQRGGRGIPILWHDTFVQPGVNQVYTFVSAVPASATYVLVYASFRYGLHPRRFETFVLNIARQAGLVHFSLSHITRPHTAQRVFNIRPLVESS